MDNEQLRQQILLTHRDRMYRFGGRAPAQWILVLAAVIGGIVPTLLLLPAAIKWTAHLDFLPYRPLIIDWGLPISAFLAAKIAGRWAAPSQRRLAIIVSIITAAVARMVIFGTAVSLDQSEQAIWVLSHLADTIIWIATIMAIISAFGSWPPLTSFVKYQRSASDTPDLPDRDHRLGERVEGYISSTSFLRNSSHSVGSQTP